MKSYLDRPERYPRREYPHPDSGTTYCKSCSAVHERKRWRWDKDRFQEMLGDKEIASTVCPACRMVEDGLFDGVVVLSWPKMAHDSSCKDQVMSLLRNEEEKEKVKNPLSRITFLEDKGEELEIRTSTEFLATSLGHAMKGAYKGTLVIDALEYEDFTRVRWTHD